MRPGNSNRNVGRIMNGDRPNSSSVLRRNEAVEWWKITKIIVASASAVLCESRMKNVMQQWRRVVEQIVEYYPTR